MASSQPPLPEELQINCLFSGLATFVAILTQLSNLTTPSDALLERVTRRIRKESSWFCVPGSPGQALGSLVPCGGPCPAGRGQQVAARNSGPFAPTSPSTSAVGRVCSQKLVAGLGMVTPHTSPALGSFALCS